jgi:hypothetical protein
MELREMLGGELRWIPSSVVYGAGGAPLTLYVPMEWGCGRTSGNGGRLSLVLLDLRWGMGLGQFWHDLWCGDVVMNEVFPDLFGIARMKNASVADNMEVLDGSTQWNVSFVREAHDWEVGVFASFLQVLHSVKVSRDRADRLWWVSSKKGLFKVKSFFRSLACSDRSGFP